MRFYALSQYPRMAEPSGSIWSSPGGPGRATCGGCPGQNNVEQWVCSSGALDGSTERTWISNYRKKKKKATNCINFYSYWLSNLKKKRFFEYLSQMIRASSVLQAV